MGTVRGALAGPRRSALILALLVVIAGCTAPIADSPTAAPGTDADEPAGEFTLDPDRELGVVDGIAANESLDFDGRDGLTAEERELVVARAMARVEVLRERPFTERVPVEVVDRETFRADRTLRERPPDPDAEWDNQVWRALFHVDGSTDVHDEFDVVYGGAVQGFFDPAEERVVLVSEDGRIDPLTLVHELVHVLQHQHFGIGYDRSTIDSTLAGQGLIEGEAVYIEQLYQEECRAGTWECLDRPPGSPGGDPGNLGLLMTIFQPYSDGPAFVADIVEREGWEALDALHERHPTTTAEIIHRDRVVEPVAVEIPDRSSDGWQRYTDLETRADPGTTVGEAALYVTFWANGIIGGAELFESDHDRSPYSYRHAITTGWAGDRLVPYHDGEGSFAFVFETAWETDLDAGTFAAAYGELLVGHGAEEIDDGLYVIDGDASFAGAYRIEEDGTTVRIVHAPTVADLDGVHPSAAASTTPEPTAAIPAAPAATA